MSEDIKLDLKPACVHLRHKMMYCDARQETPGLVSDASQSTVFFCTKTFESLGPDDEPVSPEDCGTDRPCHKAGDC